MKVHAFQSVDHLRFTIEAETKEERLLLWMFVRKYEGQSMSIGGHTMKQDVEGVTAFNFGVKEMVQ